MMESHTKLFDSGFSITMVCGMLRGSLVEIPWLGRGVRGHAFDFRLSTLGFLVLKRDGLRGHAFDVWFLASGLQEGWGARTCCSTSSVEFFLSRGGTGYQDMLFNTGVW